MGSNPRPRLPLCLMEIALAVPALHNYRARVSPPLLSHRYTASPSRRPGLAEFERHVMAADVVLIDRALIRALLRYVRGLEREVPTP